MSHVQVCMSRSLMTEVTSRAAIKALAIEAMKRVKVIEQDNSNVDVKRYKQDLFVKLSSKQRGV